MADDQDFDILDCEYDLRGDNLLGPSDQEEEPMDQGDNDCIILEGGEDLPPEPAEPPAELEEELGMFTCRDRDIYEDDPPVPASPSLYGLSQLVRDVNSSPTQEDPGVPAHSPRTEAALQPVSLDWNAEVEHYAPLPPVLEEEEQDV